MTSYLRRTTLLKKGFLGNENKFASKYILLSVKFITVLARPLVFRGKGRF
jgi:hypothetical protein